MQREASCITTPGLDFISPGEIWCRSIENAAKAIGCCSVNADQIHWALTASENHCYLSD